MFFINNRSIDRIFLREQETSTKNTALFLVVLVRKMNRDYESYGQITKYKNIHLNINPKELLKPFKKILIGISNIYDARNVKLK